MDVINALHPHAVEHTKIKVYEDIDRYLGEKKEIPSFEEFLEDRKHYLEQIWVNVWMNKVTNDISKKDKKAFLREREYEVEGIDRKLIKKLFRDEMRLYQPFDTLTWISNTFTDQTEAWEKRYKRERAAFLKREEQAILSEKRRTVEGDIREAAEEIIDQNHDLLYLYIRYDVAIQLVKDLKNNPKFKRIETYKLEEQLVEDGKFNSSDYTIVEEFFEELTGSIHQAYWGPYLYEYETYHNKYEAHITEYLFEHATKWIMQRLSTSLIKTYNDAYNTQLTKDFLAYIIDDSLSNLQNDYLSMVSEEYVANLLVLVDIPFDLGEHKIIYEQDRAEQNRRRAEEVLEEKRKEEEAKRILEDIFGREYSPSIGRNIHYVLHVGETNTGKTHHALERMKEAESGLYLAPLRLLALEVYDKLNADGIPCNLKTGEEEKEVENARHISSTVEMFHEKDYYDVVVIDESQMIADKDRGFSWYKAITKTNAKEVHIIGSRNTKEIMLNLLGDSEIEIKEYSRDIPLEIESQAFDIKHTKKGDAIVCFSRRRVLETASRLQNNGHSVSMIYGAMPPETRKKQIQRFINGETTVVVATDAIGMGLNLPIRRIVFLENEKFDGTKRRRLTSQEVKQIAGRAGRKGIYEVGKVAFTSDVRNMERLLDKEDDPVQTFAIAPTNHVFERFQKYYHDLGTFFELWREFKSPKGTKKASLAEERELYEIIRGTEIEARLSLMDLYGFLHLPFSKKEPELIKQWHETMLSIIRGNALPEPEIKKGSLEALELTYKAIGLYLLFLYRLGRGTEAIYWERIREEISDGVHEVLKTGVKNMKKECKHCGKKLTWDYRYPMCDECHATRYRKKNQNYF